jgi:hypothetical protein
MRPARPIRLAVLALLTLVVTSSLAWAGVEDVTRSGSCSGRGDWKLRVRRETASTVRVRFDIEHVRPGDTWQLYLSDNGTRIFSASRVADSEGELRAVRITANRSGTDHVKGSGVNVTAGGTCDGALAY